MTTVEVHQDLEKLIMEILAQQPKEEEFEYEELDRLYIEDILPEEPEEEEAIWKIDI